MSKESGTVKWFNERKGYGFLTRAGGEGDVFAHVNEIKSGERALQDGQKVEFDLVKGAKGLQASNIVVLDGSSNPADSGERDD